MSYYNCEEQKNIEVVKKLYTSIFDNGNCPAVDNYYYHNAVCHFKGKILSIEEMKKGMAEFVAKHDEIVTTVQTVFAKGNSTYARLNRRVKLKNESSWRNIQIMVEKKFENGKVKELWFMVDDDIYSNTWINQLNT